VRFTTEITVRGYHLDGYGHVNNARWLELLEETRWRWLDEAIDIRRWDEAGLGIAVVNINVNYRAPASKYDILQISAWMTHLGGKTGVCHQEAINKDSGKLLVDADVAFVLFDIAGGRSRAFDAVAREQLGRYLEKKSDA
jgi:thioesterase-3